ncbi:MAG: hypothetical protein IJW55_07555 [Clostridia bacterium]|nr:hypothetical protein [Clostridia bacterium]
MSENKNSSAKIAANNRYNAKAYDRINIAVKKGEKERYRNHAQKNGYNSINDFAVKAMENQIKRDTEISED